MESWLAGLVSTVPSPLRPVARIIIGAVLAVYKWAYGLGKRARSAWNPLSVAAGLLKIGLGALGGEVYSTLRWLTLVKVPALARWARDTAVRLIVPLLTTLGNALRALVGDLRRWAESAISRVLSTLSNLARWAGDRVSEIKADIKRLLAMVFGTWSTPERLATWLVGAMWSALWRYVIGQRDRFALAAWQMRQTITLKTLSEIERILGRLL